MRTVFGTNDPANVKKYSAAVAHETMRKSFFGSRFIGGEDQKLPVVNKTDLEEGPGDEVIVYLVLKITGAPIRGNDRAEGKSKRLNDLTDRIKIDRHRQPINIGDVMANKRRPYEMKKTAIARITDYWSEWLDEEFFVHASGRRGTGTNIQHIEDGYTGWPNALIAPDADHLLYPGTVASKAALTTTDTMGKAVIDKVEMAFSTMIGGNPDGSKMKPMKVQGGEGGAGYAICIMSAPQMQDFRSEVGETGMLALEKARATAEGSKSPIFQNPDAATWIYNGTLFHRHTSVTYTQDYGAGADVTGFRALYLGAHALGIAFGSSDKGKTDARFVLGETGEDHDDDTVIKTRVITGVKVSQFNGKDVARFCIDTSASAAAMTGFRA